MKLSLAFILSAIGAAMAVTDGPYSLGQATSGFEQGVLNSTIICNVTSTGVNLKNQVFGFGISAVLPNRVNASQPFTVLAGARLIVPASVNNLVYGFGARSYLGNATQVIVNAKGATPASLDVAKTPIPIPSAPVTQNGITVLEIPGSGKVITAGPFTPSGSTNVVFSIGDLSAFIRTYNSTGGATFLTANVTCPSQARPASLAFVNSGGAGSTAVVNPSYNGIIPTIPANSTAGVTGFNYNCTFTGIGSSSVRLSVGGVKKSNLPVTSGQTFNVSLGQGNIYSSQQLVNLFTSKYPSATQFSLTVSTLNFQSTNASPATLNAIPSGGLTSSKQSITSSAIVTVPETAPTTTLPDIVFTAGTSGSTSLLTLGNAAGSLQLFNSAGTQLVSAAFSCPALSPAVPVLPFDIA